MMLATPNSDFNSLFAVEQPEDVQIEIGLDVDTDTYSILVTSDERVQSVMSVPREGDTCDRRRRRRNIKGLMKKSKKAKELEEEGHAPVVAKPPLGPPSRRADALRPLSPIKHNRSSLFDDRTSSFGLRRQLSCPPPRTRGFEEEDEILVRRVSSIRPARHTLSAEDIRRESSCPPPRERSLLQETRNYSQVHQKMANKAPRMKKPDLVSAVASKKSGLLRNMRGQRKVTPAHRVFAA